MTASAREWRRLLDPSGGDDLSRPDRRLRLNLRRIEALAMLAIFVAAVEASFTRSRGLPGMIWLCAALGVGSLLFLLLARHAQRHDSARYSRLPEIFIVYVLLGSQSLGYYISLMGRVATGYGLCALACAAFFLMPPRRFAMLCLGTLAIYLTWLSLTPLGLFDKINNGFNTVLAVGFAMLGRWGLHRLEQSDEQQKRQIAEQNAALTAANIRLQANNAELNSLMAIAAHDLRSPLYGLGNLFDLAVARPPTGQAGWIEILGEASRSIAAMQTLIGRILDAHEAETAAPGALRRRDLRVALHAAARRAGLLARHAEIVLVVEEGLAAVEADVEPDALDQILDNLLSNAIRFSPRGSKVELRAGYGPAPFVEIADSGAGIPLAEQAGLFGKFRRGITRPLNGGKGSGLGLYIVRTLASAMDATVRYAPREGRGSMFRVEFSATRPS